MISDYMGAVFEDICIQYLWKLREYGKVKTEFTDLGRWWGNDAQNKRETEIDIMGTDGKDSALFCECKWTNEKVDVGVLDTLVERSRLFHYRNVEFYLFAKSGFTKGCVDKVDGLGNVNLVTYNSIFGCSIRRH
jgi:predicted helicase